MRLRSWWKAQGLVTVFVSCLVLSLAVLVAALVSNPKRDSALVLGTPQDCLRVSNAKQCESIVEMALEIHARTAPRFADQERCAFEFGWDGCRAVTQFGNASFSPNVAVIVAVHDGLKNSKDIVPLYVGSPTASDHSAERGTRVYFRGRLVGYWQSNRFGGAAISTMVDLAGNPVTGSWVRKLRQR
jgi:hypothetical protein